jgi:hypothetical protein
MMDSAMRHFFVTAFDRRQTTMIVSAVERIQHMPLLPLP